MVHGYHAIFGAYGFWLPNDPRGTRSDFVGAWELACFGRATKSIERSELTEEQGERAPRPWADRKWTVFLDSEEAIEDAIHYVKENPMKEDKPPKKWSCVTPFSGLPKGWVTCH